MTPRPSVDDYLEGIRARDRAILGRAITLVESDHPDHRRQAQELLRRLLPQTGGSHRIGISGLPGAGKSTFIEAFGCRRVEEGHRVAVLAVDPSSSVSGGSILGDKTRMERLAAAERAFIRPSPTGGTLGGVARKTRESMLVVEAAGFDLVIVETVGVGQAESVVAEMVDFFLLLTLAGGGDELQGIKRGVLELADVVAVNKADGDNLAPAQRARAELEAALRILRPADPNEAWAPRVVASSALTGGGLDEIWQAIEEHHQTLSASGALAEKRLRQRLDWMWALVQEGLEHALREHAGVAAALPAIEEEVVDGRLTPALAAEQILSLFRGRALPGP